MENKIFINNKESQNRGESNKKNIKTIVFVLIILFSLGSIYTYTDYLYGVRALDLFSGYLDKNEYEDRYEFKYIDR
jgi:hypothetical protein